jgi:beta-ureidopropionase / N-carbamoyl-L-amino-acid hydrolase
VLALAGIPSAMILVRNPTGISHAPEEFADDADCETGVTALAAVIRARAGRT